MVRDIRFTDQFETTWNARGDIDDVRGGEFIKQSIIISIVEDVGLSAPALAPEALEEHRGNVESAVQNNPFTQEPIRAEVGDVDYEAQTVTYEITTRRIDIATTFAD